MKSRQNVTFHRHPDLSGIEVCRVVDSAHAFPNHAHERIFAIGLMAAGGSFCLGPGRQEGFVAPGRIALINPGQVHSGVPRMDHPATYQMIYIEVARMTDTASDICEIAGTLPEFEAIVIQDPLLYTHLMGFCRDLAAGGEPLSLETALIEAMARLGANHAGIRPPAGRPETAPRLIREAKDLLSGDLEERITLEAAASRLGMNRYRFLRVFKRATGLPPHTYRTLRRIEQARERLRQGTPLAQVALETGFTDQSHFTNAFRQYIGATPGQYLSLGARDHPR